MELSPLECKLLGCCTYILDRTLVMAPDCAASRFTLRKCRGIKYGRCEIVDPSSSQTADLATPGRSPCTVEASNQAAAAAAAPFASGFDEAMWKVWRRETNVYENAQKVQPTALNGFAWVRACVESSRVKLQFFVQLSFVCSQNWMPHSRHLVPITTQVLSPSSPPTLPTPHHCHN